ncbi:DUF3253 domain-containing protein [Aureimonas populi]|uniref:DUF3253 domain-containing protein n=1 Tax=Aureimonas populi TaxID=1701758 RepID=A0ABW5CPB1_9HYPH|nr:DUF3253 domain-containing protein [Aureimonas populi]
MSGISRTVIRDTIETMVAARGADKTVCPSEVARALAGTDEKEWRKLMAPIRAEAIRLADEARVEIRRKGRAVDPHAFKGIYRVGVARPSS